MNKLTGMSALALLASLSACGSADQPAADQTPAAEMKMDGPFAKSEMDMDAAMKNAVGVEGIPHVLIVSTDGVVRWQGFPFSGQDRLSEDTIKRIIAADPGV